MADRKLPISLHDRVVKARRDHVSRLAILLRKRIPASFPFFDLKAFVEELTFLSDDSLREIALEAYQEGLAKAGEAQQSIEDLETIRRAARILNLGGPRG